MVLRCMFFVFVSLIPLLTSCGMVENDDADVGKTHESGFQLNGSYAEDEEYPNFKLLEIFDDRGSLEEIWDSIDAGPTNDRLEESVDLYTDEFIRYARVSSTILADEDEPVEQLLGTELMRIIGVLTDPSDYHRTGL